MTSAFAAAGDLDKVAGRDGRKDGRKAYEGAYLIPMGKIAQPSKYAVDERLGKELDETTREVLKEMGLYYY